MFFGGGCKKTYCSLFIHCIWVKKQGKGLGGDISISKVVCIDRFRQNKSSFFSLRQHHITHYITHIDTTLKKPTQQNAMPHSSLKWRRRSFLPLLSSSSSSSSSSSFSSTGHLFGRWEMEHQKKGGRLRAEIASGEPKGVGGILPWGLERGVAERFRVGGTLPCALGFRVGGCCRMV